jgi:predicted dehydrogenase/nucleoside-diphosphate-sugar epimerase
MKGMRIALIGCGAAARRYYVPALKQVRNLLSDIYCVDRSILSAQDVASSLSTSRAIDDYHEIIDRIDGAIIVLPNFLHYPVTLDFLKAGVCVLSEKPLVESVREVDDLTGLARSNGVALCVNNTMRLFPSFRKIKEIIEDGQLGKLKSIRFSIGNIFSWPSFTGFYVDPKVSSKGVLADLGSHILDIICWWLGEKPDLLAFSDDSFGGPESVASLHAKRKECTVDVLLNRLNDLESRFQIIGDRGTVEGELFEWNALRISRNGGPPTARVLDGKAKTYPEFVIPIVDNFLKVISGEEKPIVDGTDVRDSIALMEECYVARARIPDPYYDNIRRNIKAVPGKTLITGASGFIGGRIAEIGYLTHEFNVVAGIRQWSNAARLGRFPLPIVDFDLLNVTDIEKALDGVTAIVHCARGGQGATVEGTRNLLEVAYRNGIERFVHLSTAEVYGDTTGMVLEQSPLKYIGNEYNRTKIDAEKACWEYRKKGLPVVVLRPSIVYGPFSRSWSVRFAHMFLQRKWGVYEGRGDGICNLIYVDDLVKIIFEALKNEKAVGEAFNVCAPTTVTWNEYFERFNEAMGLPPLSIITNSRTVLQLAFMEPIRKVGGLVRDHCMGPVKKVAETFEFAKKMMKQTEHALKSTPSAEELNLFCRRATYPGDKAKTILGFEPSVSLDEGLNKTVEWLRIQGFFRLETKKGLY